MILTSIIFLFLLGFVYQVVLVSADGPTAFLGVSGYQRSTTHVQNVINMMNANGLNTYRMCFSPAWVGGSHSYQSSYIQYFIDNSDYFVIVDRNHLYPPNESTSSTARSNWSTVRNSIFEVLQAFPNNQRVAVELINEYVSSDFYSLMQSLVTEIRDAGYTNPIVINKFSQPWTVVNDPLDNTYQSYHYYFNSWSPSGAISNIKTALSKGIKLINTEIGAGYEYPDYTASTVEELNMFMAQCVSLGVGNTVWMNENLMNWPHYQELGLDFPTVSSPVASPTPPTLPPPTSLLFEDGFESGSFNAWDGTSRTSGESVSISTSREHHGNRSAYFSSNNGGGTERSYTYKSVEGSSELYVRGYFYVSTSGTVNRYDRFQLMTLRAGSTNVAYVGWYRTSSGLRWFLSIRSGSSTVTAYSSTIPSTGQWYGVELHWMEDSTNGLGELWVNGVKVISLTGRNTAYYGDVTSVRYGLPELYSCSSTRVYLDCVKIGNSYIGLE